MSRTAAGSGRKNHVREDHLGASTYIEKGWHLIAQGEYAGAEIALGTALDLAPSDLRAQSLVGWAIMRQGRYDEALRILEGVLAVDPGNGMARANLGYVYIKIGFVREAESTLRRAMLHPHDLKAALYGNFYLGLLRSSLGDTTGARDFFEKSIGLGPNFIEAYYELGRAYWSEGNEAEADRVWREGNSANRLSPWGRRCAEAMRLVRADQEPHGFS